MYDNASRKTILVVDDIQINRTFLKSILRKDYDVIEAEDGIKALTQLRLHPEIFIILLDIITPNLDGFGVMEQLRSDETLKWIPVIVITADGEEETQVKALEYGAIDIMTKPFSPKVILQRIKNIVVRSEANLLAEQNRNVKQEIKLLEYDEKTGIYNKYAFTKHVRQILDENPDKDYLIVRWDLDGFKVFKEIFGIEYSDRILRTIGEYYLKNESKIPGLVLYCHWDSDHFVSLREADSFNPDDTISRILDCLDFVGSKYKVSPRMGIYRIDDRTIDIPIICDRTLVAIRSVKGSYTEKYAWYDQSMSEALIEEQSILNEMDDALATGQFVVYFQPQYNYDTNKLIGAEALIRWLHPEKGLIPPGKFLPIFEGNGFITKIDKYVCEQVCMHMSEWKQRGYQQIPVSINISRRDIYNETLCDTILSIINKYDIDPKMLHIEITETAVMQNPLQLIETVAKLQSHGFHVHMDDFGSGYSSLNTLKDIPFDVLKLDMKFLGCNYFEDRSSSILGAIVHMSHTLKLPVIAEGVETKEQADFLKSISCLYMQGYYFAKPMPVKEYEALLCDSTQIYNANDSLTENVTGTLNFLSSSMQSTLLFNSFVGGAAIAEYDRFKNSIQLMRVNDRFIHEIRSTRSELNEAITGFFDNLRSDNKKKLTDAINSAIDTNDETMCELNLHKTSGNTSDDIWLRIRARFLTKNIERYVLYLAIENISEFINTLIRNTELSERLSAIISNVPGGVLNFAIDDTIKITYCNDVLPMMFGYKPEEFLKKFEENPLSVVHPEDIDDLRQNIERVLAGDREELGCRYRHICSDGSWRWVRIIGRIMRRDGNTVHTSAVIVDITDRIEYEKNLLWQSERYRIMCTANGSMTFDYTPETDYMNFTFSTVEKGYVEKKVSNYLSTFLDYDYIAPEFRDGYIKAFKFAIHQKVETSFEYRADYFGEGMRWYRAVYVSVPDTSGAIIHIVGRIDDIDNEMMAFERITSRLKTDSMTGMLNRESVAVMIEQTLRERPDHRTDAMLYIDLDNFTIVNDTVGHIGGDEIIIKVAEVLKDQFRDGDIISRSGGDTFLIYMRSIVDIADAQRYAEALMRAVSRIRVPGVGPVLCSVSITKVYNGDDSFSELFERLRASMNTAKLSGKNRCIMYE